MEKSISQLGKYWFIILAVGSLITTWTLYGARISQAESDIKDLKSMVADITEMKMQITKIETSVEFIRDRLE